MTVDSSRAVSARTIPGYTAWASSSGAGMPGEVAAPSDLSMTTGAGRLGDVIALIVDGSGMSRWYIVEHKRVNQRSIALLRRWINQYGDDRDPDLDQQIMELNKNRLSLHERC